jgi:hypothetical protein
VATVKRLALGCSLLAAVAVLAGQGTYASYSDTRGNTASAATQAEFPPISTGAPEVSETLGTLVGEAGTWNLENPLTTTFSAQWERCTGGTCTPFGGLLPFSSILDTVTYVLTPFDDGKTLRLRVTATDSSLTPTAPSDGDLGVRNATVAYSAEVPG